MTQCPQCGQPATVRDGHVEFAHASWCTLNPATRSRARSARARRTQTRMLSVGEVADRLGCSPSAAYTLVNSGQLPAAATRPIRVREADLDAFIDRRTEGQR